ncbi:MAG: MYXO-CTERM sorting domain-containing protein [Deltaproteobacteria bacterium]|nr:MYXO-CTERM sorting domain-containing protein [Deltaproteobacteria bacterium]
MPYRGPSAGPTPRVNPVCRSPKLSYFGGPVLQQARVVPVFWNSSVEAELQTNLPQFYDDVTRTPYWAGLQEYATFLSGGTQQGILTGSASAGVVISPAHCPASVTTTCTVSDAQIQSELAAQITAGNLEAPVQDCTGNTSTVYMINFPANVRITGPDGSGDSCAQFCAYHNTGTFNGAPLVYGVVADEYTGNCAVGCGGENTGLARTTDTASHELVEAATDPDIGLDTQVQYANPAAWGDNSNQCGEISDICDTGGVGDTVTYQGRTWYVQQWWSNRLNRCTSGDATLPALCAAPGPCQAAPSCAHANGTCDFDPASDGTACTAAFTCEQAQCTAGVCGVTSSTCQCTQDADCASSAGPCQVGTCAIPSGACQYAIAPEGTACTGGTCDASGNCQATDAGPGTTVASSSTGTSTTDSSSSATSGSSGSSDSSTSSGSGSSSGSSDSSTSSSSGASTDASSSGSGSGSGSSASSSGTSSTSSSSTSSSSSSSGTTSSSSSTTSASSSSASSSSATSSSSSSSSGSTISTSSSTGSSGGEATSTTSAGATTGSTGSHASAAASGSTGGGSKAESGGCGCTSTPDSAAFGVLALAMLGLRRRRARG